MFSTLHSAPRSAIAFDFGSYIATSSPIIFIIGEQSFYASLPNIADTTEFIGFTSSAPVTSVSIVSNATVIDLIDFTVANVAAVPEFSTWAMMLLGFAGVGFMTYRRSGTSTMALSAD